MSIRIEELGECEVSYTPLRTKPKLGQTPFTVKSKGTAYRRVYHAPEMGDYVIVGGERRLIPNGKVTT